MNITLKTAVKGHYKKVIDAFDRHLFEALKPPIGQMEIIEFTGSKKGDIVHIRFLKPIKAEWISNIVEDQITNEKAYFVDVGKKLPWPLETWTHRHVVEKIDENNSLVIDDMTFTGKNFLLSLLLYPAIYIGFFPRKKIYKKYFDQVDHNKSKL